MMLATSTIAMSAYNVLAVAPTAPTAGQLYVAVCSGHGTQLDRQQFIEALKGLMKRGFISVEAETECLLIRDQLRRRVRWRDRTQDGWANWMVEDPRGPQRLEDVI